MKKRMMALLFASLMALSLCACGSSDDAGSTDTQDSSQTEVVETEEDTEASE